MPSLRSRQVFTKAAPGAMWVPSGTLTSLTNAESFSHGVGEMAGVGVSVGTGVGVAGTVAVGGSVGLGGAVGLAGVTWAAWAAAVEVSTTAAVRARPVARSATVGVGTLAGPHATRAVSSNPMAMASDLRVVMLIKDHRPGPLA